MPVRFAVLGAVDAHVGERAVELGPARQRAVLGALLMNVNEVVSSGQLRLRVWGDRPPLRAGTTLRTYVARLRTALRDADGWSIEYRSAGYVLSADHSSLDLHRFRELVRAAKAGDDEEAARLFAEAFALWRGDPLSGLDTEWGENLRSALKAEFLAARLDHHDVQLRRGRHTELLPGLAELVELHPLDERLAAQHLLALYRCGRQAEALRGYERIRRQLAEELGADPGPELAGVHQRILRATADPAPPPVVPRQLPPPPNGFVGRDAELHALTEALVQNTAGMSIATVVGPGGVGKTWLALRWAHDHLARFPDGQLYVNLRGYTRDEEPTTPSAVLRALLQGLGVAGRAVPADLDGQVALYRSAIADRRMLVVLDNARDSAQVADLLPGTPATAVLITSRDTLAGLVTTHRARPVPVGLLDAASSGELLVSALGRARVIAQPHAASVVAHHACGLPLAVSILAARVLTGSAHDLTELAGELTDASARLDVLETGDITADLRAVFDSSYAALPAGTAFVFRLLGLSGQDITPDAVANLTALPLREARTRLRAVESAHLVRQEAAGRYRIHDLIRLYCREQMPREEAHAALRRLTDHYLHTAFAADRLLDPHRPTIAKPAPGPGCTPTALADDTAAFRWFTAELPNLVAIQRGAADHGLHEHVWQLAWAMHNFHRKQGNIHANHDTWQLGLTAATASGSLPAQSLAHRYLGLTLAQLKSHRDAVEHLHQSLALATEAVDTLGTAHSHYALTQSYEMLDDLDSALRHAWETHRIYEGLDLPVERAHALNSLGWCLARTGDPAAGRPYCEKSLAEHRRIDCHPGIASALDSLGYVAMQQGDTESAVRYYLDAVALYEQIGSPGLASEPWQALGDAHEAAGDLEAARKAWLTALELFRSQRRTTDADRLEEKLSRR
ncbi:BTAD domain-containing putative transcriptional regulator [Lentzea sp. NPDC006480]|uniref:AfsR/SARP family transcriptional regulator n=1 Tax=Lentzea sp. NPDC006480 TaxID=3157176 RepID=UPI0033A6714A